MTDLTYISGEASRRAELVKMLKELVKAMEKGEVEKVFVIADAGGTMKYLVAWPLVDRFELLGALHQGAWNTSLGLSQGQEEIG